MLLRLAFLAHSACACSLLTLEAASPPLVPEALSRRIQLTGSGLEAASAVTITAGEFVTSSPASVLSATVLLFDLPAGATACPAHQLPNGVRRDGCTGVERCDRLGSGHIQHGNHERRAGSGVLTAALVRVSAAVFTDAEVDKEMAAGEDQWLGDGHRSSCLLGVG